MITYRVRVLEVGAPKTPAKERPDLATTVRGTVDEARKLAKQHGERGNRTVRTVSFAVNGEILVYVQ